MCVSGRGYSRAIEVSAGGMLQQRGSARGRTPGSRDGVLGRGGNTWPAAVGNGGSAADTATEGKQEEESKQKEEEGSTGCETG